MQIKETLEQKDSLTDWLLFSLMLTGMRPSEYFADQIARLGAWSRENSKLQSIFTAKARRRSCSRDTEPEEQIKERLHFPQRLSFKLSDEA